MTQMTTALALTGDAERLATVLDSTQTSALLDAYRRHPTLAVQVELESRGVQLWAHGIRRIDTVTEPATCSECFDYVVEGETTCLTHTYDPFEVEIWNERP